MKRLYRVINRSMREGKGGGEGGSTGEGEGGKEQYNTHTITYLYEETTEKTTLNNSNFPRTEKEKKGKKRPLQPN